MREQPYRWPKQVNGHFHCTPPRSLSIDSLTSFFHENVFLICPISSFKEALCEFNLLQWKVLWLSAACAFFQGMCVCGYTQTRRCD